MWRCLPFLLHRLLSSRLVWAHLRPGLVGRATVSVICFEGAARCLGAECSSKISAYVSEIACRGYSHVLQRGSFQCQRALTLVGLCRRTVAAQPPHGSPGNLRVRPGTHQASVRRSMRAAVEVRPPGRGTPQGGQGAGISCIRELVGFQREEQYASALASACQHGTLSTSYLALHGPSWAREFGKNYRV